MPYGRISMDSAAEAESTRPFDGFDKLTASRLRAPSRFDKLKAPSESRGKIEGLTLAGRGTEASTAESRQVGRGHVALLTSEAQPCCRQD